MPDHRFLTALGWDEGVAKVVEPLVASVAGGLPGRVTRVERIHAFVHLEDAEVIATVGAGEPLPAVGDWVVVISGPRSDATAITAIAPRTTALVRRDPDSGQPQVLAANVDVVAITAPLDRLSLARVERELLIAWESGARPVVLLTKADAISDVSAVEEQVRRRLSETEVIVTSAAEGIGVATVGELLQPNLTAVFLGPSGAGKSTLANALLGTSQLKTGDVRLHDRRGRHTTTTRQLVVLPRGGVLIDTPGIRSIGIVADEDSLGAVFADVLLLAEQCRFSDCRHDREPGCAVQDAVDRGELDPDRLASWAELADEILDQSTKGANRIR